LRVNPIIQNQYCVFLFFKQCKQKIAICINAIKNLKLNDYTTS
jgi:hypothetical protein